MKLFLLLLWVLLTSCGSIDSGNNLPEEQKPVDDNANADQKTTVQEETNTDKDEGAPISSLPTLNENGLTAEQQAEIDRLQAQLDALEDLGSDIDTSGPSNDEMPDLQTVNNAMVLISVGDNMNTLLPTLQELILKYGRCTPVQAESGIGSCAIAKTESYTEETGFVYFYFWSIDFDKDGVISRIVNYADDEEGV